MKRYSAAIQALHDSQHDKMAQLQHLYVHIICDALAEEPTVLILEDLDRFDTQSLHVMCAIAAKLKRVKPDPRARSGSGHSRRPHSTILCTARDSVLLPIVGEAVLPHHLQGRPLGRVTALKLGPLRDDAVLEIAEASLCTRPAQWVADLLVGEQLLHTSPPPPPPPPMAHYIQPGKVAPRTHIRIAVRRNLVFEHVIVLSPGCHHSLMVRPPLRCCSAAGQERSGSSYREKAWLHYRSNAVP